MFTAAPSNGSQAAQFSADMAATGTYPNPAGAAYPEMVQKLLAIYRDKVAPLPFVPAGWYSDVEAIAARPAAPVIVSAHLPSGAVRDELPEWLKSDPAAMAAWDQLAEIARKAVFDYAAGEVAAGREVLDKAYADAAFWNGLYTFTKAIADAPATIVSSTLGGVQHVVGGVFGSLAKSWLVWLAVAGVGGFFAWKAGLVKLPKAKRHG